ncbi:MAG: hypothetical protein GY851_24270 [bacterium]|nr:hypothetical protein [bacterium]
MRTAQVPTIALLALAFLVCAGTADAELKVSVSITGTIDELMPILQHLKDMGIGIDVTTEEVDALKVQLHSAVPGPDQPAPAPAQPAPPAPPKLGLSQLKVEPETPKLEGLMLVSVRLSDPNRVVDTVAATVGVYDELSTDLYDNGTHGDEKALDGVWSCALKVTDDLGSGDHDVKAMAFDRNGDPVMVADPDGTAVPLLVAGQVTVAE